MNDDYSIRDLLPPSVYLKDFYQPISKKRKKQLDDFDENNTKKQKLNDFTSKSSYKTPFGASDIQITDDSFFVSNNDKFQKLKDKEIEKYQKLLTKLNKSNQNKNLNNNNNNSYDSETSEITKDLMNIFNCNINKNDEKDSLLHNLLYKSSSSLDSTQSSQSINNDIKIKEEENGEQLINYDFNDEDEEKEEDEEGNENYLEEIYPVEHEECFLCSRGNSFHDIIYAKELENLKDIYNNQRAFSSDEELANTIHLYYKKHIYIKNKSMPMLTSQNVLLHLKNYGSDHTLNADEHIIKSVRIWARTRDNLLNILFHQDGKIDKDHFNCLEKTQKILDSLYKTKLADLNFRDPNCRIFMKGSLFKISTLVENDEKIIKSNSKTKLNICNNRIIDT